LDAGTQVIVWLPLFTFSFSGLTVTGGVALTVRLTLIVMSTPGYFHWAADVRLAASP
jgi:hypothetical protein